jgi:hypothetical protein
MDSTEALASRLVGTWHSVLISEEASESHFRFLEDLRFVSIFPWEPPHPHHPYADMRLWCELESESVLRMRFYKESEGTVRHLHFEGETMVLQLTLKTTEGETEPRKMVWRCHRLNDEEIPEWFEEEFQKAMAKPWR